MHYHVVLIDDEGEHLDSASTFETQPEAEREAEVLARQIDGPGWNAKRYPGRVWRTSSARAASGCGRRGACYVRAVRSARRCVTCRRARRARSGSAARARRP